MSLFLLTPDFDDPGFAGPWLVSAEDVPDHLLDVVDPAKQGDDRLWKTGNPHGITAKLAAGSKAAKVAAPVRIVPHHRDVRLGTRGPDAVAIKRALSRVGLIRWQTKWTTTFGPYAVKALKVFQRKHGLTADGIYGIATHRKLVAAGGFDRHGAYLMGTAPLPLSPQLRLRNVIVAQAMWGYHNRDRIHYQQSRPIDGHRHPWKLPLWTDCSGTVTDWYEWAGAHDPNGLGFNGLGYTGTLVDHGTRTGSPQPADLNFYGWDWRVHGPMHTSIQVTPAVSSDLCVSHGTEAGPSLVHRRYWSAYYTTRSYI